MVGPVILPEFLPGEVFLPVAKVPVNGITGPSTAMSELARFIRGRLEQGSTSLHAEAISLVEKELLPEVLKHTKGNLSQAVAILGISRPTLRSKLNSLGLELEHSCDVKK